MKSPAGLLQNYEVMLLLVLMLLVRQVGESSEALEVSLHSEQHGELLADRVSDTAILQDKQVLFRNQLYPSPEQLVAGFKEHQIGKIALQPSSQSSSKELLRWLMPISGAGIGVQLTNPDNLNLQ